MNFHARPEKLRTVWPAMPSIATVEDLFRVSIDMGKEHLIAETHLFAEQPLRLIPYSDFDSNRRDASGKEYQSADAGLNEVVREGDVLFAIKHHRADFRLMQAAQSGSDLKEHLKLQDTHIQVVVGVADRGRGLPGVVTLNSPQSYGGEANTPGRFGAPDYPMIFVRPKYPDYVPDHLHVSFRDNIRTMSVAFNAVVKFPGGGRYNGGDPLACCSIEALQQHVTQMIFALAGDDEKRQQAKEWFGHPDNLIYCAEYAFVVASAGCHWPLSKAVITTLVDRQTCDRFLEMLSRHNNGEETALTKGNPNALVRATRCSVADDELMALYEYAPADSRPTELGKLAFQPFTAADIVDHAMRIHFEREKNGESIAAVQAAVLTKMMPGFIEMLGLDGSDASPEAREAAVSVFTDIVSVVGVEHESYEHFRHALQPALERAEQLVGARAGSTKARNLFVPPCLFHIIARGEHSGGLLGLSYVGHGLHLSLVYSEDAA